MSQLIRISHPELLLFSSYASTGQWQENSGRLISWNCEPTDTPELISFVGSFTNIRAFNALSVALHDEHADFFPNTFRIDISSDGHVWEPIIHESDFRAGLSLRGEWHFPLITARHIKFLFLADKARDDGLYFAAFGELKAMISGIVSLDTSSELDRLWVKENLIDERLDYGWSSSIKMNRQKEEISLDLGSVNRVMELRLLSKDDTETFFPEVFQVSYSENGIAWHHIFEENGFLAEPGVWYKWKFAPANMRYIKILITEGARTREGKYISQIIEMELYAAPELLDKAERTPENPVSYASVLRSGLVRLAMDGEVREGVVIQAHDRRLKEATTDSRGILRLAADGEVKEGAAVQGNDRRLRHATEDLPGIVRLARDGEVRASHALQSTDGRLRYATEDSAGLVELAGDGENRPGVSVQGNDSRLRIASVQSAGIIRLADDGSDRPNEGVQGNDSRLRNASTEYPGIMRFARYGEAVAEAAVQGNDPRLRPASTETPGILELAADGEVKEGAAVQGSDSRLRRASDEYPGIVELAGHGKARTDCVVRADDPRLDDARKPIAHEHDYAPREHEFGTHTGILNVEAKLGASYNTLTETPQGHAPITGRNIGGGAGVVGKGVADGVVGTGRKSGLLGYGLEKGVGVIGAGRAAPGGYFLSEKSYSLVAGGEFPDRGLFGSGLALLARGRVRLTDSLCLQSDDENLAAAIASYFPVENKDVIVAGDVMAASEKSGNVQRSRRKLSTAVIGVVVEKAAIILSHPERVAPATIEDEYDAQPQGPDGYVLVALNGIVRVRVTAENHPIKPGDLLTVSSQSGRAERFDGKEYRPGMIFARSLGILEEGEGIVEAVLSPA